MRISNSSKDMYRSKKWENPGASLYNNIMSEDNWEELLKEAYLVAPVDCIDENTSLNKSGCKYPHHVIKDGKLVPSLAGLKSAYICARNQGCFDQDPEKRPEYSKSLVTHINRHFKELGLKAEWHHGEFYLTEKSERKMKSNFDSIYSYIMEQTGINLFDDEYKTTKESQGYHNESVGLTGPNDSEIASSIFNVIGNTPELIYEWMHKNISYDKTLHGWKLKTPAETFKLRTGNCHDQSLFEAFLFHSLGIVNGQLFFVEFSKNNPVGGNTHTLTWYRVDTPNEDYKHSYYWFENAWEDEAGIHGPYNGIDGLKHAVFEAYKNDRDINQGKYDGIVFSTLSNYRCGMSLGEYVESWRLEDDHLIDDNTPYIKAKIKSTKNPNDPKSQKAVDITFFDNDGNKVGVASVSAIDTDNAFLYNLEVDPKFRGKGYSHSIMKYCLLHWQITELTVEPSNTIAIRLYEKYGFKKHMDWEENGRKLIDMRRNISESINESLMWIEEFVHNESFRENVDRFENVSFSYEDNTTSESVTTQLAGLLTPEVKIPFPNKYGSMNTFPDNTGMISDLLNKRRKVSKYMESYMNNGNISDEVLEKGLMSLINIDNDLVAVELNDRAYMFSENISEKYDSVSGLLVMIEGSHGKLKYCYRIGYDMKGRKVAIKFKLMPKEITKVGDINNTMTASVITGRKVNPYSMANQALDSVKSSISKTGYIDFATDDLHVEAIFYQNGSNGIGGSIDHVIMIPMFSRYVVDVLNKSARQIASTVPKTQAEKELWVKVVSTADAEPVIDSDIFRSNIEHLYTCNPEAFEKYSVGEYAGKDKYKTTKLIWNRDVFMSYKYTPAIRGYNKPGRYKFGKDDIRSKSKFDDTIVNDANDYIDNRMNNRFHESSSMINIPDRLYFASPTRIDGSIVPASDIKNGINTVHVTSDSFKDCDSPEELLRWMDRITYGWISNKDGNVYGTGKDDDECKFYKNYRLQSPSMLSKTKVGVCWDQTELERSWFNYNEYIFMVFYIEINDKDNCPSHTFLVYETEYGYNWFEHSWEDQRGIHEYKTISACIKDVIQKHQNYANDVDSPVNIYKMPSPPKYGCTCQEFMDYAHTQPEVNIGNNEKIINSFAFERYDNISELPDTLYFASPNKLSGTIKVESDKGLFLTPYKGIASMFCIDRSQIMRHYIRNYLKTNKRIYSNYNISYAEWDLPDNQLMQPLSRVHMIHNIPSITSTDEGDSLGYIHEIDISSIKNDLELYVTGDANREVVYKGQCELPILNATEHEVHWSIEYKNTDGIDDGSITVAIENDVYDPPLSYDKLPDHLKNDPVHSWRAKTGIELIHKEPTIEELERIWKNWNLMTDDQKRISDEKSIELFGIDNTTHYWRLVKEYHESNTIITRRGINRANYIPFTEDAASMPDKADVVESNKNGVNRKKLYIAFIEWCKEYNPKNTFGSLFDKDVFTITYPFVPNEMRYFYRLANPALCVLSGDLTFFQVSELKKLNSKNSKMNELLIFAATPDDMRVFNTKDKKVYRGTDDNGNIKLNEALGDSFDLYIQNMIKKGDILNSSPEEDESTEK